MLPMVLAGLLLVTPSQDAAGKRPHPESPAVAAQSRSPSEIRQGLLDLLDVERARRGSLIKSS
jgi:hypothetical protein